MLLKHDRVYEIIEISVGVMGVTDRERLSKMISLMLWPLKQGISSKQMKRDLNKSSHQSSTSSHIVFALPSQREWL